MTNIFNILNRFLLTIKFSWILSKCIKYMIKFIKLFTGDSIYQFGINIWISEKYSFSQKNKLKKNPELTLETEITASER